MQKVPEQLQDIKSVVHKITRAKELLGAKSLLPLHPQRVDTPLSCVYHSSQYILCLRTGAKYDVCFNSPQRDQLQASVVRRKSL